MLEEILVGEESLERAPGRVRMLEFVRIEPPNGKHGDPREEEPGGCEQQVVVVGAAPGICR